MCSFLLLSNIPLCICTRTYLSILLQWTSRLLPHSSYCIVSSVSINNGVHVSVWMLVSSGYMPRAYILLGHMVVLFLVFKAVSILSSVVAVLIYIPTNGARRFPFSTPSQAFIVCRLFDGGHSDWCEVISHCSFDLLFSNNEPCWASFHVFVSHLYVFFGEISV